jgi:photosystem II stability/assembly factor-like uncharacterized protein
MQSVAMSSDGTKITAGAVTGKLYVSNDSGVTFINKTSVNENWYAITMSSDGTKQVATTYAGLIYNSNDSGNTWTLFANTGRTLSGFAMSR